MAWRAPQYAYLHAIRDAGVAAITANTGAGRAFSTTQPEDHLIDNRAGSLCTFTAAAADHYIQIDRGAGTLEAIDRIWIPAGHNMGGTDIKLQADDNDTMASATSLIHEGAAGASVSSGAIDITFASNSERYVRFSWPNDNFNPQIGELVLTRTRTLTQGIEPGWRDEYRSNVDVQTLSSGGQAGIVRGAQQRVLEFRYRGVDDSTDLGIWDEIIAAGLTYPLLVDPPFDDEAVVWCRLQEAIRRVQDPAVPATTNSRQAQIDIRLLEHVL